MPERRLRRYAGYIIQQANYVNPRTILVNVQLLGICDDVVSNERGLTWQVESSSKQSEAHS